MLNSTDKILNSGFLIILTAVVTLSCSGNKKVITPIVPEKESEVNFFDVDAIRNTFTIDGGKQIKKYNKDGRLTAEYADITLGPIGQLDVFNPQKILVYYSQFNKAVILDQSLSSTRFLDLEKMGLWDLKCLGVSGDQNLWIFDQSSNRLKKVNVQGSVILESESINLYHNSSFIPSRLIQRHNFIYLSMPSWGWLRFDLFGEYHDSLSHPHDWFHINVDGEIIYWKQPILYKWKPGEGVPEILNGELHTLEQVIHFLTSLELP